MKKTEKVGKENWNQEEMKNVELEETEKNWKNIWKLDNWERETMKKMCESGTREKQRKMWDWKNRGNNLENIWKLKKQRHKLEKYLETGKKPVNQITGKKKKLGKKQKKKDLERRQKMFVAGTGTKRRRKKRKITGKKWKEENYNAGKLKTTRIK